MRLLAKTKASAQKSAQGADGSAIVGGDPLNADVDYEVEYNNRARVPENPALMAGWASDAAAYREAHQAPRAVIPYGPGERHTIDFFPGEATARSSSSFTAATGRRSTVRSSAISPAG